MEKSVEVKLTNLKDCQHQKLVMPTASLHAHYLASYTITHKLRNFCCHPVALPSASINEASFFYTISSLSCTWFPIDFSAIFRIFHTFFHFTALILSFFALVVNFSFFDHLYWHFLNPPFAIRHLEHFSKPLLHFCINLQTIFHFFVM